MTTEQAAIAQAVRGAKIEEYCHSRGPLISRDNLVYRLCKAIKTHNPQFDEAEFVKSIELETQPLEHLHD